jgi:hypothetical protein
LESQKVTGSLQYLDQVLEGAHGGSVVLPYVQSEGSVYEMLVEPLVERLGGAKVFFSGKSNKQSLPNFFAPSELCAQLNAGSAATPEVVLVNLDGMDNGLETVDSCVFEKTGGKYLAVFASPQVEALHVQARAAAPQPLPQQPQFHSHAVRSTTNNTDSTRPPTYFPTYVWGWLLVLFFLITFFIIGVQAISQVQVPPKLLSADQVAHRKNK